MKTLPATARIATATAITVPTRAIADRRLRVDLGPAGRELQRRARRSARRVRRGLARRCVRHEACPREASDSNRPGPRGGRVGVVPVVARVRAGSRCETTRRVGRTPRSWSWGAAAGPAAAAGVLARSWIWVDEVLALGGEALDRRPGRALASSVLSASVAFRYLTPQFTRSWATVLPGVVKILSDVGGDVRGRVGQGRSAGRRVSPSQTALLITSTVGNGQRLTLPVTFLACSYHCWV